MMKFTHDAYETEMAGSSDELTARFTQALFAKFPEWRVCTERVTESSGNVAIEVKIPQEGTERFLYIETTEGEITIGFDRWHTHVGPYLGIDIAESVRNTLEIIEAFVREETVVVIIERNGRWAGSSLEDRQKSTQGSVDGKVTRLSWKLTFDEEVDSTSA